MNISSTTMLLTLVWIIKKYLTNEKRIKNLDLCANNFRNYSLKNK